MILFREILYNFCGGDEMTFTDYDLKKMLDDCIKQVKRLGYDLYPIVDIKFTPGSRAAQAYVRPSKITKYNPYTRKYENVAFCIRVNGIFKDLPDSSYDDLKATVMHEVIHVINPHNGLEWVMSPFMYHGNLYHDVKKRIEKTYHYKHIYDLNREAESKILCPCFLKTIIGKNIRI